MISIFYVPCYQYVGSVHPVVYQYLEQHPAERVRVFNLNSVTNLDRLLEQSTLLVFDYSIIEAIRVSVKGQKETKNYLYLPHTAATSFYKNSVEKILQSPQRKIFWASMNDAQNLFTNLDQLEWTGISRNYFLDKMEGIIWFFNSGNLAKHTPLRGPYTTGYEEICQKIIHSAEFVSRHFEFEFEIPHCIAVNKRYPAVNKKWDGYVPGVLYPGRKLAVASVQSSGLKSPNSGTVNLLKNKFQGLMQRFGIFSPGKTYQFNQRLMNYLVRYSAFTFVCGGPARYFVKKFLEIPMQASVLVGYGPGNFADYGFIRDENYIHAEPELFGEVVMKFLTDTDFCEKIARAAYTMVSAAHSVEKRSEQLIHSLEHINLTAAKRGKFINGVYTFTDKNNLPAAKMAY